MSAEPETGTWKALVDDLHAEFDQGHMTVCRIVERHRPGIQTRERRAAEGAAAPAPKPDGWHTYHVCGGRLREIVWTGGQQPDFALCVYCGQTCRVTVEGATPAPPAVRDPQLDVERLKGAILRWQGLGPNDDLPGQFWKTAAVLIADEYRRLSGEPVDPAVRDVVEAARVYFEATANEPIEGGPPSVAYILRRAAATRQAREALREALGITDDPPRWHDAAAVREPVDPEPRAAASFTVSHPVGHGFRVIEEPSPETRQRAAEAIRAARGPMGECDCHGVGPDGLFGNPPMHLAGCASQYPVARLAADPEPTEAAE